MAKSIAQIYCEHSHEKLPFVFQMGKGHKRGVTQYLQSWIRNSGLEKSIDLKSTIAFFEKGSREPLFSH